MARFTQGGGSGDGSALNYVQNKVAQPVSVTGYPTTIASLTIVTTGKPVQISLTGEGANNQAASWVKLNIFRDGQAIGNEIQIEASAVSENVPYAINVIDEVGAGEHLYEAIIVSMSAGNWSFGEVTGPIMNAVELTGFKGDTGAQGETGPQGPAGEGGETGPKTWTSDSNGLYSIRQAHGGIEVALDQPSSFGDSITIVGNVTNSSALTVSVPAELSGYMNDIYNNGVYFRRLSMDFSGQTRNFRINYPTGNENEWSIDSLDGPLTTYSGNSYYVNLEYGGAPSVWWDADNLGLVDPNDNWQFRGAKIEYHAYSVDSGTMIGTIYIASDSGDNYVTHIETNSGANDNGNVILWKRSGNERQLYAYRADNEDDTVKIHWTAQVYYGTEYYD